MQELELIKKLEIEADERGNMEDTASCTETILPTIRQEVIVT
jgi:hypothetical protein